MSESNVARQALRKKYQTEIEQDLEELQKKQACLDNIKVGRAEEIHFKIELIKYLTAELANTKAELMLLKQQRQSAKESH